MTTRISTLQITSKAPPRLQVYTRLVGKLISRFLNTGIYDDTSPILSDRIVYSNWLCVIGTCVNVTAFVINTIEGDLLCAFLNCVYQIGILICFLMNRRKSYLMGRLILLFPLYIGIFLTSAVQGPVIQMEHYFLAIAALAFTVFHPSERRWAWLLGIMSAVAYFVLVNRTEPLIHLPELIVPHSPVDLKINQCLYILLYIPSLIALSNAYARATEMADKQRAELYESNKLAALGQMAGGVAHEIINPLAIIDALTQKVNFLAQAQEIDRKAVLTTAEQLQSTTHRIVSIVRGLQVLSRNGKMQPLESTSIIQVVEDTLAFCHERFKNLSIELHFTKPPHDLVFKCRVVQLSQALLNLLINACDAVQTQETSWIHVSIQETSEEVLVSVRNSGEKIPKHVQEKLFQPFFTTKDIGRGTGLGLSISLAMMKQNGGTIRLDPTDPHTNFVISLPKTQAC
ncbi:MAG: sensor histidine kinase [Bdellovibrionia bacterium]